MPSPGRPRSCCTTLHAVCRIVAGAAGDTHLGAFTTAHVLVGLLRRRVHRDPSLARFIALLTYSMGDYPRERPPLAIRRWCAKTLRLEMARAKRLARKAI